MESIRKLGREYRADPRHKYVAYETDLNVLGYELLSQKKLDAAVAVQEMNAEAFPQSWNAWDSLAEALMVRGDMRRAAESYEKSLQLNPKNANAQAMLEKLRE